MRKYFLSYLAASCFVIPTARAQVVNDTAMPMSSENIVVAKPLTDQQIHEINWNWGLEIVKANTDEGRRKLCIYNDRVQRAESICRNWGTIHKEYVLWNKFFDEYPKAVAMFREGRKRRRQAIGSHDTFHENFLRLGGSFGISFLQ